MFVQDRPNYVIQGHTNYVQHSSLKTNDKKLLKSLQQLYYMTAINSTLPHFRK